jgi:hypothetical protein
MSGQHDHDDGISRSTVRSALTITQATISAMIMIMTASVGSATLFGRRARRPGVCTPVHRHDGWQV